MRRVIARVSTPSIATTPRSARNVARSLVESGWLETGATSRTISPRGWMRPDSSTAASTP